MILFLWIACGVLAAGCGAALGCWSNTKAQLKLKRYEAENAWKRAMELANEVMTLENDLRTLKEDFEDIQIYPCKAMLFTVRFGQDDAWQIVDMSRYNDKKIAAVTVGLTRGMSDREAAAAVDGQTVIFENAAIWRMGDKYLWEIG